MWCSCILTLFAIYADIACCYFLMQIVMNKTLVRDITCSNYSCFLHHDSIDHTKKTHLPGLLLEVRRVEAHSNARRSWTGTWPRRTYTNIILCQHNRRGHLPWRRVLARSPWGDYTGDWYVFAMARGSWCVWCPPVTFFFVLCGCAALYVIFFCFVFPKMK